VVHEQLDRYYQAILENPPQIAEETETIFRQKLELGLFNQPPDRLKAMETLTITRDISQFQFVLILVDYNPYSRHFQREKLASLPFADQVRIFYSGFAMWERRLKRPMLLSKTSTP
jgi:hypothetical protein